MGTTNGLVAYSPGSAFQIAPSEEEGPLSAGEETGLASFSWPYHISGMNISRKLISHYTQRGMLMGSLVQRPQFLVKLIRVSALMAVVTAIGLMTDTSLAQGPPDAVWYKTFGGFDTDVFKSVQQTSDGGYVMAGRTVSYGTDGSYDFWVVKTDSSGNMNWSRTFNFSKDGTALNDAAECVQQTSDGGYIIAGSTEAYSLGFWSDACVVKADSNGIMEWERIYDGGPRGDYAGSIVETSDGGYVVAGIYGSSSSIAWLFKIGSEGAVLWDKRFTDPYRHTARSVDRTSDGGYIILTISRLVWPSIC
jgi:hypothetical protein